MLSNLPNFINILFGLTTFLTVFFFYRASNNSNTTLLILLSWIAIQAIVAASGFYTVTNNIPPRFVLSIWPALLVIIILFLTRKGRAYIDNLDIKTLTILHTIRIPAFYLLPGLCKKTGG